LCSWELTSRGLKVTCGVIALGHENVVVAAASSRLVQRDGWTHELLLDPAETVETWLKLKVVVAVALSDGGDDGDVVPLGADVVCGRDDSNVDV
jgi:hypothetical protein